MANPFPSPDDVRRAREEAKARHPAGKAKTMAVTNKPVTSILRTVMGLVEDNAWLYGAQSPDAPSRQERWDIRSIVDYAVVLDCFTDGQMNYGVFYHRRQVIMKEILQSLASEPDQGESPNYGDLRYWETENDRTGQHIQQLLRRAIDALEGRG